MNLRLALITAVAAALTTTLVAGPLRPFANTTGVSWCALTGWMMASTLFSLHRGGSVGVLINTWALSFISFYAVSGALSTLRHVRQVVYAIGIGNTLVTVIALIADVRVAGRLTMVGGHLGNPNLFALHIICAAPFAALPLLRSGTFSPGGIYTIAATLVGLYAVLLTGSRAALIAVLGVAGVLFLIGSGRTRIKLLVGGLVIALIAVPLLPSHITARYALLFGHEVDDPDLVSAEASAAARQRHLRESLALTAKNPLFGVGPGMFIVGSADESKRAGERAAWLETHNAYTQASSETGIPGFLFFMTAILYCVYRLWRVQRASRNNPACGDLHALATLLLLSFAGLMFCAVFANIAYAAYFPLLTAIGIALLRIAKNDPALQAPEQYMVPALQVPPTSQKFRTSRTQPARQPRV